MTHSSRRKGNRHEREIVELAEGYGFDADRAWGSNGKNLGEVRECDCVAFKETSDIELKLSAKRRKSIANYLTPPDGTDGLVVREDYGDNLLVIPLEEFLELIQRLAEDE